MDKGCRCTHKDLFLNEKTNCFAYRRGECDCLKEPCKNAQGRCKFYKPNDTYIAELKQCALRLDMEFNEYLRVCGLNIKNDWLFTR